MKNIIKFLALFLLVSCGESQPNVSGLNSRSEERVRANLYDALASPEVAARGLSFNTLRKALKAADLDQTIRAGNLSLFAPTDKAFAKIPEDELKEILSNKTLLVKLLSRHVSKDDSFTTWDLLVIYTADGARWPIKMLSGDEFDIFYKDYGQYFNLTIANAQFESTVLNTDNGKLIAIDTVL